MIIPAGADQIRLSGPAKRRRRWLAAVRVAVAAGVVGYLLHIVSASELAAGFAAVAPAWVVIAALLQFAVQLLSACTLAILLRPHGLVVPIARIFAVNLAAAFYNLLTPAGTLAGGAIRWYRLGYHAGRMPEVLAALVAIRLLEIAVLAGLACLALLAAPLPGTGWLLSAAAAALFAAAALAYAGLFSRPLALRLIVLMRRFAPGRGVVRRLALRLLLATRAQARLSRRRHAELIGFSLLRHLTAVGSVYALAVGLGLDIGFASLVWVRSLTTILIMLPISFAGFGVREAVFVVLLQPYGVPAAEALLLALLASALALLPAALGGLLEVVGSPGAQAGGAEQAAKSAR